MKRYYHFLIILQPQGKVMKDLVLYLTEKEYHEHCARIAHKLAESGMSYNGKNANHYYDFITRDITEEYPKVMAALARHKKQIR